MRGRDRPVPRELGPYEEALARVVLARALRALGRDERGRRRRTRPARSAPSSGWAPSGRSRRSSAAAGHGELTARELEVLRLVARGHERRRRGREADRQPAHRAPPRGQHPHQARASPRAPPRWPTRPATTCSRPSQRPWPVPAISLQMADPGEESGLRGRTLPAMTTAISPLQELRFRLHGGLHEPGSHGLRRRLRAVQRRRRPPAAGRGPLRRARRRDRRAGLRPRGGHAGGRARRRPLGRRRVAWSTTASCSTCAAWRTSRSTPSAASPGWAAAPPGRRWTAPPRSTAWPPPAGASPPPAWPA